MLIMGYIAIIFLILFLWFGYWAVNHADRIAAFFLRRYVKKHARRAYGAAPRQPRDSGRRKASWTRSAKRRPERNPKGPVIPREYAEDVEYTETRYYSAETRTDTSTKGGRKAVKVESQVSDAEYVEIKQRRP